MADGPFITTVQIVDTSATLDDVSLKLEVVASLIDDAATKNFEIGNTDLDEAEIVKASNSLGALLEAIGIVLSQAREEFYESQRLVMREISPKPRARARV